MTTRFIGRPFHRAAAAVLVVSIAVLSALPAFGAEGIPGTATLTGTVSANEPFIAAQVYAKNLDRNMLYTVFTHNGSYRAPNLLPGGYRIWAEKDGLTSRHEMLRIHGEGSIELDLAMRPGPDSPPRILRLDVKYPLDEAVLASAMFIEYLTPLHPGADLSQRSANEPFKHRLHRPMMDNDGNLWGSNSLIGLSRVDPRTAQWSHFPIGYDENNPETDMYGRKKGEPGSVWSYIFPHDLTIDREGHVFWAEFQGQHLGRLDPKTGRIDRYHMDPEGVVVDENGVVGNIRGHTPHMAENGDVWFTAIRGNKLGKWDRETAVIRLWEIPTAHSFPYGIEIDHNGIVWFAELFGCAVASFDPETEEFREYPALTRPCAINRLAADSRGTIWYSVFSSGRLGRLDPATGAQKEYDILPFSNVKASMPYGIVADADDQIWFGDGGLGGALVRFDPGAEEFTYFPEPRQADNPNLDVTREGAIIFSTRSSNQAALGIFYPDVSKMTGYGAYR